MKTLAHKIATNTAVQVIGKIVSLSIGLASFGLITRYLGAEGYGLFATVYGFLAVFGILVDFGLQMTTTQLISRPGADEGKILSNALTLRLVASVIFLGAAPLVAWMFPYPALVKTGIVLAAVGFVFASLNATLTSVFQKHLVTWQAALAESAAKITYLGLILLTLRYDGGLLAIIGATAADTLVVFLVLLLCARKLTWITPRYDRDTWRLILKKTWPQAVTIGLNLIYFKGDIIILSLTRPVAEVGVYGAPYKILEVLINMAYLFLGLILPVLTVAAATKNFERLKFVTQSVFDALVLCTIPLIFGSYFTGVRLLIFFAGNDFAVSGLLLPSLMLATGCIIIAALFGYVIVALQDQKAMIKFYAANAVLSLALYVAFIPRQGIWAAAWITVVSELFILLTAMHELKRQVGFSPNLYYVRKALGASAVMGAVLFFVPTLHAIPAILLGAVVYGAVLWMTNGVPRQVLSVLSRQSR